MKQIPCAWCGAREWTRHCATCRWLKCPCGSSLDLQAMVLLPPVSSGQGPMPAE